MVTQVTSGVTMAEKSSSSSSERPKRQRPPRAHALGAELAVEEAGGGLVEELLRGDEDDAEPHERGQVGEHAEEQLVACEPGQPSTHRKQLDVLQLARQPAEIARGEVD